jgi:hypothetical protein
MSGVFDAVLPACNVVNAIADRASSHAATRRGRRSTDVARVSTIPVDPGNIPPLDKGNGEWVSSKIAAMLESVSTRTLANYRAQGRKGHGGEAGVDSSGRQWSKPGPHAHVWYLKSSLLYFPRK